jgi:geranylgeranyl pyrophosphate synthase
LSATEIEQMYAMKTGALIHASVFSAAVLHDDLEDERLAALDAFGRNIGIAFQIKDDILDIVGETEIIGKSSGSDERLQKATYPGLLGIEQARRRCDQLLQSSLEKLDDFGDAAASLRWIARFIVERGN